MTRVREAGGSNPGVVYRMDIAFFTFVCLFVCLKRSKMNEKEAGIGQF